MGVPFAQCLMDMPDSIQADCNRFRGFPLPAAIVDPTVETGSLAQSHVGSDSALSGTVSLHTVACSCMLLPSGTCKFSVVFTIA